MVGSAPNAAQTGLGLQPSYGFQTESYGPSKGPFAGIIPFLCPVQFSGAQ